MTRAILTGEFASAPWDGTVGALSGNWRQLGVQIFAVLAVMAFGGVASFILLKAVNLIIPLRVSARAEGTGLDVPMHGEEASTHGEGAILVMPPAAEAAEPPAPIGEADGLEASA